MIKTRTILALAVTLLGLSACTKAPAMKRYALEVPQASASSKSPYKHKTLKVSYPQSLRENMSEKMNFSYSMNDVGLYQNSEWSNTMSKLLQGTLIDVLDQSRYFKAVLSDTSSLRVNYRLESNVFAFEHRVRGNRSDAVVSIQFTFIDADTGTLVKSRRFSYQEATRTTDAKGYASATNVIIRRLSKDLLAWLH